MLAIDAGGGGAAGLYAWNVCVVVFMYTYEYVDVVLHCASVGVGKPVTVLQIHG